MKSILHISIIPLILLISSKISQAQSLQELSSAPPAFRSSININTPTNTFIKKRSFEFQIRHRFGMITPDEAVIKDFLGMDLTANIQFAFQVPLGSKTMLGVSRTKSGKTYSMQIKRALMIQNESGTRPVSVSFYTAADANSNDFSKVQPNTYFSDGTTPFENKFDHRLSYNSQLIFSRRVHERISLQLSPGIIYRNLVSVREENLTGFIPLSGTVKSGTFSSFLFEYAYLINHITENNLHPVSIGYEFGTAGHVFQITVSSSPALNETELYTSTPCNYDKGEFYLGFNIRRVFWQKKKLQRDLLKQQNSIKAN